MRPIPAPRLGDAHGLLRAISERERLRLDEFVTEFTVEELFPPGLENALGRTRQFVSFARATGLLNEDRGTVELTEMGKRYVRAADADRPFEVVPAQAEWLRRLLRERHMTDSVYHGASVALSLCASNPPDFRVSTLDFGRAISYLGRAGWDNENTFSSQGERYTTFLRDLELIDAERRLTATGQETRDELTLPIHASLKDLAAQLNPGGLDAAIRDGEAEVAVAAPLAAAESQPVAAAVEAAPPATEAAEDDEYEDVGPGAGPSPAAAPLSREMPAVAPAAQAPPTPPPDVWDVATPDERTRAYTAISPDQPAAGAVSGAPAVETPGVPPVGDAPVRAPVEAPAPAPPVADQLAAAAAAATVASPAATAGAFVAASAIRGAAEELGLRLPPGVYAAVAAALAGGHVVLVGPPGSGKTTLALAIAKAAAQSGKSRGATVVTAAPRWSPRDIVGRPGDEEWERGIVVDAAARGRWLIVDELERARLDRALGDLSSFLAGVPVTLADGEAAPPDEWRVVATAGPAGLDGSAALVRRFAHVRVPAPDDAELHAAIDAAAGGDPVAAAAVKRLLGARELGPVGAGAFLAAARFAAARNAAAPADERTLAREALTAHVAPLLTGLDDDGRRRLAALAGWAGRRSGEPRGR
jgi:MoxR-like ATPase